MSATDPESGVGNYPLLNDGDRRFAVAAELLIAKFGSSTIAQPAAIDYLTAQTDGAIKTFGVDDYRMNGWIDAFHRRNGLNLNPAALLSPANIHFSRVTSRVIEAALDYADGDYRPQVEHMLYDFGVQTNQPIADKDKYAFGFVMTPKKRNAGRAIGVMAVQDARLAKGESESPAFTTVDDLLHYFGNDLGGIVLSHERLVGLIRGLLDESMQEQVSLGGIVDKLSKRHHYFSPYDPNVIRSTRPVNGLLLTEPNQSDTNIPNFDDILDTYWDLHMLRHTQSSSARTIPHKASTPVTQPFRYVEPENKNTFESTLPSPPPKKQTIRQAAAPATIPEPEPVVPKPEPMSRQERQQYASRRHGELQRAAQAATDQLQTLIDSHVVTIADVKRYMAEIAAAKEQHNTEELQSLVFDMRNLHS